MDIDAPGGGGHQAVAAAQGAGRRDGEIDRSCDFLPGARSARPGDNIKCGNSLIGPDFYDDRQLDLLDDEERFRINVFDWEAAFRCFQGGGFDAVIGNPPWGAEFQDYEQQYLRRAYTTATGRNIDSYAVFMESGLRRARQDGRLSYIVPDTFLRKPDYKDIRDFFLARNTVHELVETGPVFSRVRDTWCLVFSLSSGIPSSDTYVRHRKISRFVVSTEERLERFGNALWDEESIVPQTLWTNRPEMVVGYLASEQAQDIIRKMEESPALSSLESEFTISRGEEGSKFSLRETERGEYCMVIPADVERYYVGAGITVEGNSLTPSKRQALYTRPKIWLIRIQKLRWEKRLVCGFDARQNSAGMKTLQVIISTRDDVHSLFYLQGILASRLVNFWCINFLADDMNKAYLQRIPIRAIDFADPADVARHARMVALVEQMLALHKQLAAATLPLAQEQLQRRIDATDRQIDALVYELYGLTDEEIAIVEGRAA